MLGAMCKAVLGRQGPARMFLKLKCRHDCSKRVSELEPELAHLLVSYRSLGIGTELTHPHSRTIVAIPLPAIGIKTRK